MPDADVIDFDPDDFGGDVSALPMKVVSPAPAAPAKKRERRREFPEDVVHAPANASAQTFREPPHATDAEEKLISCCLLDGRDVIEKCLAAKLARDSFFVTSHGIVFACIISMHMEKKPIEAATVAEELRNRGELEAAGGYSFIVQVSSYVATTLEAGYFIERVALCAQRREVIRRGMMIVEGAYTCASEAELLEVVEPVANLKDAIVLHSTPLELVALPLADFKYPVNDPDCLIGVKRRYLGRGGSLLIPAPAGIGKSSSSYQMAACWGCGRDFLGLDCVRPLRIVVIQMEDDRGDVGEVVESIRQGLQLTAAEWDTFRQNVRVIRNRKDIGNAFPLVLRQYVRHFRPDVVIINPLMRYCPGLSKEEIAGPFLSALDVLSSEFGFLTVAFHHTPKPPVEQPNQRGKGPQKRDAVDRQYTAFGSSALTNWARAIINITGVRGTPGQFVWQFDKRGSRAGLTKRVPAGAGWREEFTTEIRVQHSQRKITVEGKEHAMILWERVTDEEIEKANSEQSQDDDRPRAASSVSKKFTDTEALEMFPQGHANRMPIHEIQKRAVDRLLMSRNDFSTFRLNFSMKGLITSDKGDGKIYRP
jgi:hypothetical protein